jgi:squalene-associated FAD-dependent desaturase
VSGPHIAVVGGGLAGLAAALACADAGATVTLLEKRSRLGGLTWSFRHDGLGMDNGQHVFLRCCTAYLDFLERIGSAGDVELQARLDVTVIRPGALPGRHPAQARLKRDEVPAPLHLARSLIGFGLLPVLDRARFGPAALALSRLPLDDPALDEQTFADWLRRHGQSETAIAALWDLICLPTVNLPAEQASLAVAAKVFQTGLLTRCRAGDIGWSRAPLGALHGERGERALARAGAKVLLGEEVTSVGQGGDDGPSPFVVRTATGELGADGVIVALPHHHVEKALPAGALADGVHPGRLGSSPIVNVHVHFDRKVMDLPFVAGLGTAAQWVFDRTASSGAERGQYLAVSISGAESIIGARPEALSREVVQALGRLFPPARQAEVLSTFVTKEHHATFRAAPGSAAHRASARTGIAGLALAGAWTATGWPPTMEGAVRSGRAAARSVLVATGVRAGLPSLSSSISDLPTKHLRSAYAGAPPSPATRPWRRPAQHQEVMGCRLPQ